MLCNFPKGCKAAAMRNGEGRCWFHSDDPAIVAQRTAARSHGGKVPHRPKGDVLQQALELAATTMQQLSEGSIRADKAKMIARLCEVIVYGHESVGLQEKLNALKHSTTR